MSFSIVIPARYASTRLPNKPLRDIAGKPLIQHVYECALKSDATEIIIATDHPEIESAAKGFGATVCMTSDKHNTGTDRLAEVVGFRKFRDDHVVVNLQGDEPLMPASVINQVANNLLDRPKASVATVCAKITDVSDLLDPNAVKVVFTENGYALYFSRAPIPWDRDSFPELTVLPEKQRFYRHIGLYAYRAGFLKRFVQWPVCLLEQTEKLEQLRALWHGEKIHVAVVKKAPGPGVDTEADLDKVRRLIQSQTSTS